MEKPGNTLTKWLYGSKRIVCASGHDTERKGHDPCGILVKYAWTESNQTNRDNIRKLACILKTCHFCCNKSYPEYNCKKKTKQKSPKQTHVVSWKKKKGCVAVTDERTRLNENVGSWTGSDTKKKMLKDIVGTTDKNRTWLCIDESINYFIVN